jgi:hypothetical protein
MQQRFYLSNLMRLELPSHNNPVQDWYKQQEAKAGLPGSKV